MRHTGCGDTRRARATLSCWVLCKAAMLAWVHKPGQKTHEECDERVDHAMSERLGEAQHT